MENTFCLKQIVEKKMAVGNQIHFLFINLMKAHNNVPITKLWNVLNKLNMDQNIIRTIQELYRQSKTNIKKGII